MNKEDINKIPTFSGMDKLGRRHWGDLYRKKMKNGSIEYYIIEDAVYSETKYGKEINGGIYEVRLNTLAMCYLTESEELNQSKGQQMDKIKLAKALKDMGIEAYPDTFFDLPNNKIGGMLFYQGNDREFRIDVSNGLTECQEIDIRFNLDDLIPNIKY